MLRNVITVLTCVTILVTQMVGLHLHASVQPSDDGLHAVHIHGADPDGHDHAADVDVTVVEYGAIWAKLVPILFGWLVLMAVPILALGLDRPLIDRFLPTGTALRWRPPLRAPPSQI
jgi:hypothetical protein